MKTDLSHLMTYIVALNYSKEEATTTLAAPPKPIVTISRQRGARGKFIAEKTAALLSREGEADPPWLVVDRSLAQRVMEDHHLSAEICRFLTEEQAMTIHDRLAHLLHLHASSEKTLEKMMQTALRLAEIGHIIFVGRAAHVVTARHPRAYHIHIIGSFERRVEEVMAAGRERRFDAELEVRKADHDRACFASSFFHINLEDPFQYHLTINSDRMSDDTAARMIADLVLAPEPGVLEAPSRVGRSFGSVRHEVSTVA
jgi:cytidylate kinase